MHYESRSAFVSEFLLKQVGRGSGGGGGVEFGVTLLCEAFSGWWLSARRGLVSCNAGLLDDLRSDLDGVAALPQEPLPSLRHGWHFGQPSHATRARGLCDINRVQTITMDDGDPRHKKRKTGNLTAPAGPRSPTCSSERVSSH